MKIYSCCGKDSIAKKYYCPSCGESEFKEREVNGEGSVYSFTKIHIAPSEFAHIAPYNVVLVDLDEANAKITTRIEEDVEIGDKVTLDRIEDGAYIYKKTA
ncbi:Zn-ribbon domain-containing OB-fold protein [Planococcus salinus]|uniref:Nucleic acid-binding protein n=1 Tax=Planococcus salinus TaxID=1848460 RepID=A0A3M8PAI1_9BACL|nr:OB-fold domain-containing protein [Planococcus salinus]RNF40194.1 nucleic acid-binding protein [Planococcus salinus]